MMHSSPLSPSSNRAAPILPMAMRDTALTVTELKLNATITDFAVFRERCKAQVKQLRAELAAASYSTAVIDDAAYAQCALLDEIALVKLNGSQHDSWERDPLQMSEFQSHEAGIELIDRVERRLADPHTPIMLLGVFFETFNQGFKGKYMIAGEPARDLLLRALDSRAGRESNPSLDLVDLSDGEEDALNRTRRRPSRLIWAALAAVATVGIYGGLQLWMSASLASLPV